MNISATDLKKEIKKIFPKLKYLWVWQHEFFVPSIEEIKEDLKLIRVDKIEYIPDKVDCDVFSLLLHSRIVELDISQDRPHKALGQVFVDRCKGENKLHKCNVVYTTSGLYFIEGQNNDIWIPNKKTENPLYMEFI